MVRKIVKEVFKKAKEEYAATTKTTLSKYIAEKIDEKFNINISERTLIRSYDKYILEKKEIGSITAENVDLLCKYLGYADYSDYKRKNTSIKTNNRFLYFGVLVVSVLITVFIYKNRYNPKIQKNTECMVWENNEYVKISCAKEYHPKFGTKVIVFDKRKMKNMKKVILKRSTPIFSTNGKPLYWYRKINSKEVEFFTAPGLHPVTGKTLKAITEAIFYRYVPIHSDDKDSFVQP